MQAEQKTLNRVSFEAVLLRFRHRRIRIKHALKHRFRVHLVTRDLHEFILLTGLVPVARGLIASWEERVVV